MSSRILVDEIYGKTANTSALTIDSSGRVLMPQRPAFQAYGVNPASATSSTNLVFQYTHVNVGNCYSTSTGKFTAPIAGIYYVSASGLGPANTSTTNFTIMLNDASWRRQVFHRDIANGSDGSLQIDAVMNLSANDTVNINAGSGYWDNSQSSTMTSYFGFCGFLIG